MAETATETADETAWYKTHPLARGVVTISRALFIPLLIGVVGAYFNAKFDARDKHEEVIHAKESDRTNVSYETSAVAVKELQDLVRALTKRVGDLESAEAKTTAPQEHRRTSRLDSIPAPAAVINLKPITIENAMMHPLPKSLDEAVRQRAK